MQGDLQMAILDFNVETYEIQLNDGSVIIIDAIDADDYMLHPKWVAHKKTSGVYAGRFVKPFINRRGTGQHLHVLIFERVLGRKMQGKEKVDHIDGNTLNCRRSNLRLATNQQNTRNSRLSKANKTGYKGVMVLQGRWVAKITVDAKSIQLGRFETAIDAAIAYNIAAVKLFGEFARINPIDGWETIQPKRLTRNSPRKRKSKPYLTRVRYQGKRWAMIVKRDGKEKSLGLFETEIDAREYERTYKLENAA
jgi:hypothetical protein